MENTITFNENATEERIHASNTQLFRGKGVDVSNLNNNPEAILAAAGLDWKAVKVPLQMVGRNEVRSLPEFKALVNSKTGQALAAVGSNYQPFQNEEMVNQFSVFAEKGGMNIATAGQLYGGRRVFVVADMDASFSLGGQDPTRLQAIFSTGHGGGASTRLSINALRQICLNGLCIWAEFTSFALNHRGTWTPRHSANVQQVLSEAIRRFGSYEAKARLLWDTPINEEQSRQIVAELLQPALLAEVAEQPIEREVPQALSALSGGSVLDSMLASTQPSIADAFASTEAREREVREGRNVRRVLELVNTSPGSELRPDSAWNLLNAITYWTDHERGGRGGKTDASVESAQFGVGQTLKTKALERIVNFAQQGR